MTDNTEYNTVEFNDISGKPEGVYPENEETLNNKPVIEELEPVPKHLGAFTKSAEFAYKLGWDIENNYIAISDTQKSDLNGWTYRKELCPMKNEEDKLKDQYRLEIQQLKKLLSDSDYKAIKFAEGQISEEEYAEIKSERQGYRDRINYLEGLL